MNRELIFEVGVEELPARFINKALSDLSGFVVDELAKARLDSVRVCTWGTPRRLTVRLTNLPEQQPDLVEEFKGPAWKACFDAEGHPTRAAEGFAASKGIAVSDLKPVQSGKAEYAFAYVNSPGKKVADLLPELLSNALSKLVFPKNMYWADPTVRFARPVRWLLCLLDDVVIPVEYNGMTAGRITRGHRFMGSSKICVEKASDYSQALYDNFVIVDHKKREEKMLTAIAALERDLGGVVELDPDLIEENLFLTEYPVPFVGHFSESYLDVPEEVLITSMKANQKYFACRSKEGKLLPKFVAVSNNKPATMDRIRQGNERVLKGRLDDAVFFWKEDQKEPFANKVSLLSEMVYQEQLGSLLDKTKWLVEQVKRFCVQLDRLDLQDSAVRAAHLSKADLVTNMVGEFPELQGIMGQAYALRSGEKPDVALAIREQYLPRYAGDELPSSLVGALVGLAERCYTMLSACKLGYMATGSQDPYGLRRAARCVNELFWSGLNMDLNFTKALSDSAATFDLSQEKLDQLLEFLSTRTLIQLKERGYDHHLADMAMSVTGHRPAQLVKLLEALGQASKEDWFAQLAESATRVKNLLSKNNEGDKPLDQSLFQKDAERELLNSLESTELPLATALECCDWRESMKVLSNLAKPVSKFFEDVMVMAPEEDLRANRLALLKRCDDLFTRVGDLSRAK